MVFFQGIRKNDLVFPEDIDIAGNNYKIKVVLSDKKNSSVSVRDNLLSFKLSKYISAQKTNEHFNELLKKIVKKIEKTPQKFSKKTFDNIFEKGSFEYANEKYYIEQVSSRGIKLYNNTFYVNSKLKTETIEKTIIKILIDKYYERLKNYLEALNLQTYNYPINGFELKSLTSKWGHCTHDNKILLNAKLLNARKEVLDYVIFHELSHVKVKNHSSRFWAEVQRFCPQYPKIRKELKNNPPEMFK